MDLVVAVVALGVILAGVLFLLGVPILVAVLINLEDAKDHPKRR